MASGLLIEAARTVFEFVSSWWVAEALGGAEVSSHAFTRSLDRAGRSLSRLSRILPGLIVPNEDSTPEIPEGDLEPSRGCVSSSSSIPTTEGDLAGTAAEGSL